MAMKICRQSGSLTVCSRCVFVWLHAMFCRGACQRAGKWYVAQFAARPRFRCAQFVVTHCRYLLSAEAFLAFFAVALLMSEAPPCRPRFYDAAASQFRGEKVCAGCRVVCSLRAERWVVVCRRRSSAVMIYRLILLSSGDMSCRRPVLRPKWQVRIS